MGTHLLCLLPNYYEKDVMFTGWGYPVEDTDLLKERIAEQALHKYVSGDYKFASSLENNCRKNQRCDRFTALVLQKSR